MAVRKSYPESCRYLQQQKLLEVDTLPELPARMPRVGDTSLGVRFFRMMLADARLEWLTLPRTLFGRSEIRGVSFIGTDLSESSGCWNDFVDVDFGEADLSRMDLRGSIFLRVNFRAAILRGADLRGTSFEGCTFADADMTGAKVSLWPAWLFRLSAPQRRSIRWHFGPGPEPQGG